MSRIQQAFVQGCCRALPDGPAFTLRQAETLWDQVAAFSGYGFNQGHATAYADISYRLAYLKAHWPAELLCARLINHGGFHHQAIYLAEAARLGITIRPPHINHSNTTFTLSRNNTLWMGLGQVRDLRRSASRAIIAARQERRFSDLRDLLARVDLQTKEIAHLIQCGALDNLGSSRAALLGELAEMEQAGSALQLMLPFDRPAVVSETAAQRLAWERFVLGLPVSLTPLQAMVPTSRQEEMAKNISSLSQLPKLTDQPVTVCGYRLSGWTGGAGFYLGDGQTFVWARGNESLKTPSSWQPLLIRGRWQRDSFGTSWLQVDTLTIINNS
jgi:DNA polymerase III alpha subunit